MTRGDDQHATDDGSKRRRTMTSAYTHHEFITDWIDRSSDELNDGGARKLPSQSVWARFDRRKMRQAHADRRASARPARVRRGMGLDRTLRLLVVDRQRI
jgi:hypothetical protein